MSQINFVLTLFAMLFVSCSSKTVDKFDEEAIVLTNHAVEILTTNPDSALILLDKATEIDNNYYPAYSIKVTVYCSKSDYDNAIKAANQGIEAKPDLAESVTFLGMLYDYTGQPNKAKVQYQKAIELYDKRLATSDKNKQANRLNRALTLLLTGNQFEGEKEVKALLHENPEDFAIQILVDFEKHKYLDEIFRKDP